MGRGGVLNVFLRVNVDGFLFCCLLFFIGIIGGTPAKRINFRSTKYSFYVFGVFVDSRERGGTPVKRILEGLFDCFRQTSRFNFRPIKT